MTASRSWRAGLAAALLAVVAASPAGAEAEPAAALALVSQPSWHGPDDALNLEVRVTNPSSETVEGLFMQITAHIRAGSRTALHAGFEGEPGFGVSSFPVQDLKPADLAPGESMTVKIDDPVAKLASLTPTSEGGVYPLTISLLDGAFRSLDSLVTPLVYYPSRPQNPLNLVLVVPLNDVPARGPDGVFDSGEDGAPRLEAALEEGGWIDALLHSLEQHATRGLHLALAPTPRLLEEIADMADGYRRRTPGGDEEDVSASSAPARAAARALDRIRALLDLEGVQAALVPYSFPDLPHLASLPEEQSVATQVAVGEAVLGRVLDRSVGRAIFLAPAERVDELSLRELHLAGAASTTFFSEEALEPAPEPPEGGCPSQSPTFACPVVVTAGEGTTSGFVADAGIRDRFAALANRDAGALDGQMLLAETAMMHAELPGTERVTMAVFPAAWQPPPRLASRLITALARAPWLRAVTPEEGLSRGIEHGERAIVPEIEAPGGVPDDDYHEAVDAAADMVESFESTQPDEALLTRLRRNVLVAQSRAWWEPELRERGRGFATATAETVEQEFGKIRLAVPDEITLTSEQGTVQIQMFSEARYPMKLVLRLESRGLTFEDRVRTITVTPPAQRLSVNVSARSSGIFPLEVTIAAPDGRAIIDAHPVSIRSTSFNDIALVITIGALAFLVLFYVLRVVRRQARRDESTGTTTA